MLLVSLTVFLDLLVVLDGLLRFFRQPLLPENRARICWNCIFAIGRDELTMMTDGDQVAVVVMDLFLRSLMRSNLGARLAGSVGAAKTFSSALRKLA